jgi:hypothetical protein
MNQSFQSSELEVVFFQMDRAATGTEDLRFGSLSKVNIDISQGAGEKRIVEQGVHCHVEGLTAYRFGAAGMKTLAHVSGRDIGHQQPDVYDWAKILFHPDIQGLGATIEALNLLAAKFSAPFVFKATAPVTEANRYFHSWFQSTHNVRAGVVEGGHRCETAMRTFYGYKIDQTVPLLPTKDFRPINANSTLVQPFSVNVIQPDSKYHLISKDVLRKIRAYSQEAQELRSQVVKPTFKTLWWKIFVQCGALLQEERFLEFITMTNATFAAYEFQKKVKEDPFTVFIEAIKSVVTDRYFDTEPGRDDMKDVDKEAFLEDIKNKRLLGRNFKGIADVSAKWPSEETYYGIIYILTSSHAVS